MSVPTDEELAAIVSAYRALHPNVVVVPADGDDIAQAPAWRFSGRWWSRPIAARRVRPWA